MKRKHQNINFNCDVYTKPKKETVIKNVFQQDSHFI